MYLEHFELRDYPFRLTPDTDYLYMSSAHAHAKAYMDYTVWNREGFVIITGEIGCGKTILVKKLLTELQDENILVAKIFQTQLDETELLQAVLVEFGLNPFNAKKVELIDMLNTFLVDCFQQGKQLVLIVDDAHNLTLKALEEIRMLSGLETQKEKILHVILVGQPQLNEMLDLPEMEQLVQRVRLRFHLRPLSLDDTAAYITHRLMVAGATRADIFTDETASIVFKYTAGIPRLINTLCDTALTVAYADELKTVTIDELQWQPYDRRTSAQKNKKQIKTGRGNEGGVSLRDAQPFSVKREVEIDMLGAVLSQIVDKMSNIEGYLAKIAESRDGEESQKSSPRNTRKNSGKER
jgi:general secretion pathway protein A